MAGVCVAVEELDRVLGGGREDRVVDAFGNGNRAHRLRGVGQRLGHRHDVGRDAEALCRERLTGAAEAGDHLVEHQQDAVLVADFPQPLEIALGRNEHAGRSRDRLDEARGDVLRAVEIDEALQVLGQVGAVRAFAGREPVLGQVRVAHVRDAGQRGTEAAAVVDQARQRNAAEVDAVIGALPRHEHRAAALAARLVVGERDLHRGVDRFGAGVHEEDPVEIAGRQFGHSRRKLELLRVAAQERRAEIEFAAVACSRHRRSPCGNGRPRRRRGRTTRR